MSRSRAPRFRISGGGGIGNVIYQLPGRRSHTWPRNGRKSGRRRRRRRRGLTRAIRLCNNEGSAQRGDRASPSNGAIHRAIAGCLPRPEVTRRNVTRRGMLYELLTTAITSTQDDVIICDIVATARTVRHTVTTAFCSGVLQRRGWGHFTLEQGPLPSLFLSFSLSLCYFPLALSRPLHLSLDAALDWFILIVDPSFAPRLFRSHRHHYYKRARVTAFSFSVSTDEFYRSTSF